MANISKSRLIVGVISLVLLGILIVIMVVMLKYYDPISGLTFLSTPTAFPVTIGNLPSELKEKQRVYIEGHLIFDAQITSMDLGDYGWRDKLRLLKPDTWDMIPIWFETTTSSKKEPNQVSGISFNFEYGDIVVYDDRAQEVRPGDLIRVEGRLAPAGSDWHLIVEKIDLLKAYPRITLEEGYADLGDVNLVDSTWTEDGNVLLILQATKDLSIDYALDVNGQTTECNYWNQMIYCTLPGLLSGEEVQINLLKVYTHAELEDLLFSEVIRIP